MAILSKTKVSEIPQVKLAADFKDVYGVPSLVPGAIVGFVSKADFQIESHSAEGDIPAHKRYSIAINDDTAFVGARVYAALKLAAEGVKSTKVKVLTYVRGTADALPQFTVEKV